MANAWLGPLRPPRAVARRTLFYAHALAERLGAFPVWLLAGICIGTFPPLIGYVTGLPGDHVVSALLLTPVLVAAAARDAAARALGAIGTAFLAHSALAMALVAHDPGRMDALFPEGAAYWEQSRAWIVTGISREYSLAWWLPAHVQLLGAMVLFTYTSLGLVPLWQGMHEVDLMNFYVGHLLAESHDPWVALAVGWHPWSLCRGLGYLLITFEVTNLSLGRLTGVPLSTPMRRWRRWLAGITLLLLDGVLKFVLLEPVRRTLAANLI
jgi:hypothetical protein